MTIQPGGTVGWHSHPGPVTVFVQQGTLTTYAEDDPLCRPQHFTPGMTYNDRGAPHVHLARNEGTVPVVLLVLYTNVALTAAPRIDAPAPGNCAASVM